MGSGAVLSVCVCVPKGATAKQTIIAPKDHFDSSSVRPQASLSAMARPLSEAIFLRESIAV